MARNRVQFQKGLSLLAEFYERAGSAECLGGRLLSGWAKKWIESPGPYREQPGKVP